MKSAGRRCADSEQGRVLVESAIRDNLDLGHPERVSLTFERQVTKRTPSAFHTRVISEGVLPSIHIRYNHCALKQYSKDGRAFPTERMINNAQDLGVRGGVTNFSALVELGRQLNHRLLEQACISQDCFVPLDEICGLCQSTVAENGQRASTLRFGDQWLLALLAALALSTYISGEVSNRALRQSIAQLLGILRPDAYSSAKMSYDLRRSQRKGLIECIPCSHRYVLPHLAPKWLPSSPNCTNDFSSLVALVSDQRWPSDVAQALNRMDDVILCWIHEALFPSAAMMA